jgi:acyl-CoA synthetase (AMP-forming)/AMP-acid ligase II
VLRRVRPAALDGFDFGRWRGLIIGAEPVDAALLDRFSGLLEPHGFVRRSLLPAYGLAEATVAVTGCSLDEEPTVVHASPAVAIGQPVRLHSMAGADTIALVGCGPPLRGVRVSIVDEHGAAVPDGHSGEIVVSGPSVADSIADQATGSHTRIAAGRVWTADVGVLVGGQLFVLGRIGDCVKVRGQTLFAEALEARAARAGADPGRTAILLGMERGEPTAVLLIERSDPQTRRAVSAALRRSLDGVPLIVVDAPTRTIMRTSSGKPRRRQMWQRYAAGLLGPGQGESPS